LREYSGSCTNECVTTNTPDDAPALAIRAGSPSYEELRAALDALLGARVELVLGCRVALLRDIVWVESNISSFTERLLAAAVLGLAGDLIAALDAHSNAAAAVVQLRTDLQAEIERNVPPKVEIEETRATLRATERVQELLSSGVERTSAELASANAELATLRAAVKDARKIIEAAGLVMR
jgi:hypothetical protein